MKAKSELCHARAECELAALGIGVDEGLTPAQLFPFDQYHYHGTDAVDTAVHLLGLSPASHVLDVGSGLGGPARYLASAIGCHITALELQGDLHAMATRLTSRVVSGSTSPTCAEMPLLPLFPMPRSTPSSAGSRFSISRSVRVC